MRANTSNHKNMANSETSIFNTIKHHIAKSFIENKSLSFSIAIPKPSGVISWYKFSDIIFSFIKLKLSLIIQKNFQFCYNNFDEKQK